jgi:hypothetical protein
MFRWWHWPHQHKTAAWSGAEGELYVDRCYSRPRWPSTAGKQGTASASAWHRWSQTTVPAGSGKYQQEHIWAMSHDSCHFRRPLQEIACIVPHSGYHWFIPNSFHSCIKKLVINIVSFLFTFFRIQNEKFSSWAYLFLFFLILLAILTYKTSLKINYI